MSVAIIGSGAKVVAFNIDRARQILATDSETPLLLSPWPRDSNALSPVRNPRRLTVRPALLTATRRVTGADPSPSRRFCLPALTLHQSRG